MLEIDQDAVERNVHVIKASLQNILNLDRKNYLTKRRPLKEQIRKVAYVDDCNKGMYPVDGGDKEEITVRHFHIKP